MNKIDALITTLREEGVRITPQRMAIVDCVTNTEEHPSAEQIHKTIKRRYPTVSLSTVYNTLDLLRQKNMINQIEVGGEARFDAHVDDHVNLVCLDCGKIIDLDEDGIRDIQSRIAKKSKYLIVKSNFEFHGYCEQCRQKVH